MKYLYDIYNFRLFIAATNSNIGECWCVLQIFITRVFVINYWTLPSLSGTKFDQNFHICKFSACYAYGPISS